MEQRGPSLYIDRIDAGAQLARSLLTWTDEQPVVLGIPRGGVIVAAEVAMGLHAPLDVIVVRKVGAPLNPELAIGAVTADGQLQMDAEMIGRLGISPGTLTSLISEQQQVALAREQTYRSSRQAVDCTDRTVIIVDDGLATGSTMLLAIEQVRAMNPKSIIAAVPVGSRTAIALIADHADAVVCPLAPDDFMAVGQFYTNFDEVSDADVIATIGASTGNEDDR